MSRELLVGVSQRPNFLIFEKPFSDRGRFDHWAPSPNEPMQGAIEDFMHFAEEQIGPRENAKLDTRLQSASSVGIEFTSHNGQANRIQLRVVEGQFLNSDRKIVHIGLPHFRQVMILETKTGPEMKFRRAEWITEWISAVGMYGAGALNYPAGPAQIAQYSDILSYTKDCIRTGSAKITSRIVAAA